MSTISGWVGTGAGLITIGICVIASMFVHHLPKLSHPWIHRFLIVLMYCGATAVAVTTIGQFAIRAEQDVAGWFGGVGTGIGKVAIILAALFLLLSVVLAIAKDPAPEAGILAVALVFVLVLVPGGALRQVYSATAQPGQLFASQVSAWMGG